LLTHYLSTTKQKNEKSTFETQAIIRITLDRLPCQRQTVNACALPREWRGSKDWHSHSRAG
jgi:hypothetical protein